MLACAVDTVAAAERLDTAQHIVRTACWDIVKVERQQVAAAHGIRFPACPFEDAGDKAADILQVVLLAF